MFAQGDILIIRRGGRGPTTTEVIPPDPDGAVVLGRGEVTGHRHAIFGGAVLFRDDGMARDIATLGVGRLVVTKEGGAELRHEEHGTVHLPQGEYEVRRQREYEAGDARLVAD